MRALVSHLGVRCEPSADIFEPKMALDLFVSSWPRVVVEGVRDRLVE